MQTYKKYLSLVTEQNQFLDYQEAKAYLDDMVRTGQIQSYDESKLKDIYDSGKKIVKDKLLPLTLAGGLIFNPMTSSKASEINLENPQNNIEMVISVKKDLQNLELEVTSLTRHTIEFKNQSKNFEKKIAEMQVALNKLKKDKAIDQSKIDYYGQRLEGLKKYLKDSAVLYDDFTKDMQKLEKETKDFNAMMEKNEKNKKNPEEY